jgi:hypothetical protein
MRLSLIAFLAYAAIAEARAFRVVYTEHARFLDPWLVGTTMSAFGVGLIFASTGNPLAPTRPVPGKEHRAEGHAEVIRNAGHNDAQS